MYSRRSLFYTDPRSRAPKLSPLPEAKLKINSSATNNVHIDVWVKPKKLSEFSDKRNSYCEVCLEFASFCSSIDAYCIYCNIVCHITCLSEKERSEVFRGSWVCSFCSTEIEGSKAAFIACKSRKIKKVIKNPINIIFCKHLS